MHIFAPPAPTTYGPYPLFGTMKLSTPCHILGLLLRILKDPTTILDVYIKQAAIAVAIWAQIWVIRIGATLTSVYKFRVPPLVLSLGPHLCLGSRMQIQI